MKTISNRWILIFLAAIFLNFTGCSVNKQLIATGGSRSDGIINMSYEIDLYQIPNLDVKQIEAEAKRRCAAWGYTGAEPFGGFTETCINSSYTPFFNVDGCSRWRKTIKIQCTNRLPVS